jgi:hypothetical protein
VEAPAPKAPRARKPKAAPQAEAEPAVEEALPSPEAADDADAESDEE